MKIRIVPVLMIVALLAACASLPSPDKGNKTLLVIAVKLATPGTYSLAYDFGITDTDEVLAVNPKNGIYFYDNLKPGSYTIDSVTVTAGPGMGRGSLMGGASRYSINRIPFKLQEGLITVLPVTIVVYQEMTRPDVTTQGFRLVPTNRDEALAELAKYDNFDAWRIAP